MCVVQPAFARHLHCQRTGARRTIRQALSDRSFIPANFTGKSRCVRRVLRRERSLADSHEAMQKIARAQVISRNRTGAIDAFGDSVVRPGRIVE